MVARLGLCPVLLVLLAAPAAAQVLRVDAGTSTLFSAQGAGVEWLTPGSSLAISGGVLGDDAVMGFRWRRRVGPAAVALGDEIVDFSLPTDVTRAARYLPVRGAGLTFGAPPAAGAARRVYVFGGTTSTATGAPFFRGARGGDPIGLVFASLPVGPNLLFSSRTVVAAQPTTIQSLEWRRGPATLGASGGIGANEPFAAAKASLARGRFDGYAGYARPSGSFRRVAPVSTLDAESDGESLGASWRLRRLSLNGSRQNLLARQRTGDVRRATVNEGSVAAELRDIRVTAGIFASVRPDARVVGTSVSLARHLGRSADIGGDVFRTQSSDGTVDRAVSMRVRQAIRPGLSLLGVVSQVGRRPSVNIGGQWVSNYVTIDVGHQSHFVPLGDQPIVRTLSVDARVQTSVVTFGVATYVTPGGSVKYTVSGSRAFSVDRAAGRDRRPVHIGRYRVSGQVVDEQGRPVPGMVVDVGGEVLVTNDAGQFALYVDRREPVTLKVLTDESATPGRYRVRAAPDRLTPSSTDAPARIELQRE